VGIAYVFKNLNVFILHGYLNRISENRFIFWQVFLIILAVAFLHNLIFLVLTMFTEVYASGYIFWSLMLAGTLMTAVIGSFLHLVRTDR